MNIAVIPARGGSKRIPRKNILTFGGRPMIGWPIEIALKSGLFERVIISTDDEEIAAVAREWGADVPFMRPPELSGDHVGTLEVIQHAAVWAAAEMDQVDLICCIYATAPFLSADDLENARTLLIERQFDYVFAAARHSRSVFRSFQRSTEGVMELIFPQYELSRSQDLPPAFYDAGQFYWGSGDAWRTGIPIYGPRTGFIELPEERVQDIDTPEDWAAAEHLFAALHRRRS